ncbi:bactofilin family protein [Lichenicoccus roseus]|uniref:bactofilin family protein n=1 Tax=Lichenicoccus roseus TaxID=2683649 RepID=UPI001F110A34|nr:polymer-forming cytoskeletal protein [Lichenicoccus roseus]
MFKRRKPDEVPSVAGPATIVVPTGTGRGDPGAGLGLPAYPPGPGAPPSPSGATGVTDLPSPPANRQEAPLGRAPFSTPPLPTAPPAPRPGGLGPSTGPGLAPPSALQSNGGQRPREATEKRTLVVGRGISVQGTVQDAERLVVEGTVEASMIEAIELHVAPGGMFRGSAKVQDAEVAGTVDGTLTASGTLTIRPTGRVIGSAKCGSLTVEPGGQVTGQFETSFGQGGAAATVAPAGVSEPVVPAPVLPQAVHPEEGSAASLG